MKRCKRPLALLALTLALGLAGAAEAELNWPVLTTPGQEAVKALVTQMDQTLPTQGLMGVNSLFECYRDMMTLGVTSTDNAELPEGVELSFVLTDTDIASLTLRMSDVGSFAAMAGSCLNAVDPAQPLADCIALASARAKKALNEPGNSFSDTVEELRGPTARAYFAYAPNEYHDGVNWITMTVIFPRSDVAETVIETPVPTAVPTDGRNPDVEE